MCRYFIPSAAGHHCMLHTYKELLNKHAPKTFTVLNTIGALDSRYLNLMFVDMFVEILPEHVVLTMMDAYLLEGLKVFYRFGIALVLGYKAQLKAGKYASGSAFWSCVKADAVSAAGEMGTSMLCKTLGNEESLPVVDPFLLFENAKNKPFLQDNIIYDFAYDTERSIVQKASKPLNISRAMLKTLAEAAEKSAPAVMDPASPIARKSITLGARKNSITETIIEKNHNSSEVKSGTMSRKSSIRMSLSPNTPRMSMTDVTGSTPPPPGGSPGPPFGKVNPENEKPVDIGHVASAMANESSILSLVQSTHMLSHCVSSLASGFTLRYTTKRDGWHLSALYAATTDLSPCLLLVSLLAPYNHVVLGAYVNTAVSPPSLSIRGDLHTTCFSLNMADPKVFKWQGDHGGSKLGKQVANDIASEGLDGADDVESSTLRQFAVATNHYLVIGGSREHGTNALRLDENMQFVHTGFSDTFNNPPLLVPEGADGQSSYQFEVDTVELWCGTLSFNHAKSRGHFSEHAGSSVLN